MGVLPAGRDSLSRPSRLRAPSVAAAGIEEAAGSDHRRVHVGLHAATLGFQPIREKNHLVNAEARLGHERGRGLVRDAHLANR